MRNGLLVTPTLSPARREESAVLPGARCRTVKSTPRIRRSLNRAPNSLIGGAAADIAVHGLVGLLACWTGSPGQKGRSLHDLSRLTVTTLRNLLANPAALNRMAAIARETFNCCDLLGSDRTNWRLSGSPCLAIQVYCACTAESHAAAIFSTRKPEGVAQNPEQGGVRCNIDSV